jgi:ABC-type sugar transport system ATPase subunit
MSQPAAAKDRATPLLQAVGVSKRFGHVEALIGVDFELHPNEVVGLVGDNGAGKSTLIKVLCGVHRPDEGTVFVGGREVRFHSPRDALKEGIAVVYQDLALVNSRDLAHNVFLGREPRRGLTVDRRRMQREAREVLDSLRIQIPSVRSLVGVLSGGQRQAVAIARAVHQGGRLMIMDEPTAALGVQEQRKVLALIQELQAQGSAVIVVSHNLEHVFSIADRIVVLRGGRVAGSRLRRETTAQEIVSLIVGVPHLVPSEGGS